MSASFKARKNWIPVQFASGQSYSSDSDVNYLCAVAYGF